MSSQNSANPRHGGRTFSRSTATVDASTDTCEQPDGRRLKRERNIDTVRDAVIELLAEGTVPRIADIARRSGLTTRSVYRYFGDARAAIDSATSARLDRAIETFRSEPTIDPGIPVHERVATMTVRRLRLDRIIEPIGGRFDRRSFVEALDDEVRRAFAPELGDDLLLARTLCGVFRLRSVRSIRDAFDGDEVATTASIRRLVCSVLVGGSETDGTC